MIAEMDQILMDAFIAALVAEKSASRNPVVQIPYGAGARDYCRFYSDEMDMQSFEFRNPETYKYFRAAIDAAGITVSFYK